MLSAFRSIINYNVSSTTSSPLRICSVELQQQKESGNAVQPPLVDFKEMVIFVLHILGRDQSSLVVFFFSPSSVIRMFLLLTKSIRLDSRWLLQSSTTTQVTVNVPHKRVKKTSLVLTFETQFLCRNRGVYYPASGPTAPQVQSAEIHGTIVLFL